MNLFFVLLPNKRLKKFEGRSRSPIQVASKNLSFKNRSLSPNSSFKSPGRSKAGLADGGKYLLSQSLQKSALLQEDAILEMSSVYNESLEASQTHSQTNRLLRDKDFLANIPKLKNFPQIPENIYSLQKKGAPSPKSQV